MFNLKFCTLLLLGLVCTLPSKAATPLHKHSVWLTLNSYEQKGTSWFSNIRNSDFFIAEDGPSNPQSELAAFIALAAKARTDPAAAQLFCQYPARIAFLKGNLISVDVPGDVCAQSEVTDQINNIRSISLIFADGYFGNPASYYGHVLLKLNTTDTPEEGDIGLLDTAINYGAKIPPNENPVVYIGRGVFGFYKGSFQTNQFYMNTIQYADQQSRDFWAYDLSLTPAQAKHIAQRAIEWKRAKFDYYFFGDNCAHRIRDLLAETTSQPIVDDNGLWLMPMQVLTGTSHTKTRRQSALVANIRYLPSGRTRLFSILETFDARTKRALLAFLDGNSAPFERLSKQKQKITLAAADLHLRNKITALETKKSNDTELEILKGRRSVALLRLFELRNIDVRITKPTAPLPPHLSGRNGTAISIGAINSERHGMGTQIIIRPAYTDLLAPDIGKIADSTLQMGNMLFTRFDDSTRLEKLTFIEVESLRAAGFDKRFNPGRVWHLSAGLVRDTSHSVDNLRGFFKIGIGRNHLIERRVNAYAMAHLNAEEASDKYDAVHPGLTIGLVANLGSRTKGSIDYTIKLKADDSVYSFGEVRLRTRLNERVDFEILAEKSNQNETSFAFNLIRNF